MKKRYCLVVLILMWLPCYASDTSPRAQEQEESPQEQQHPLASSTTNTTTETSPANSSDSSEESDDNDGDKLAVKIVNHNNHKITVNNQDDPDDCTKCVGERLKECMLHVAPGKLVSNIIGISCAAREELRRSLSPAQAERILARLDEQSQQRINDHDPEFIPYLKDIVEQGKQPIPLWRRLMAAYSLSQGNIAGVLFL